MHAGLSLPRKPKNAHENVSELGSIFVRLNEFPGTSITNYSDNIFYNQIYNLVSLVPKGKVVSYGKIAAALGRPRAAREVGRAMRICPGDDIPWQRVVMSDGSIAGGNYAHIRRDMLADEGVTVLQLQDGKYKVDMKTCNIDDGELEILGLIVQGGL